MTNTQHEDYRDVRMSLREILILLYGGEHSHPEISIDYDGHPLIVAAEFLEKVYGG